MPDLSVWGEAASDVLLSESWSFHSSGDAQLLLKIAHTPDQGLALLATDLQSVYYEHATKRQIARRLDDAFAESSYRDESELVKDGETQKALQELVDGIKRGGTATLESAGFEHMIAVALPEFTFRFVPDPIDATAISALATHLVTPLLGLSSSLLSLCKDKIDDGSLTSAIDASARAERAKEGRSIKTFFDFGSSALARWSQRHQGVKEKELSPVHLKPTTSSRKATPVPSASPRKKREPSPAPAPAVPSKSKSAAKQMLDHRGPTSSAGERVTWETQQSRETAADEDEKVEVDEEDVEEPATDDEEELPPTAQPPSSPPVDMEDENEGASTPPTLRDLESQQPAATPEPEEEKPKVQSETKEEKRRKQREAEEAKEAEIRAQTLAKAKAAAEAKAKADASGPKKKRKKL